MSRDTTTYVDVQWENYLPTRPFSVDPSIDHIRLSVDTSIDTQIAPKNQMHFSVDPSIDALKVYKGYFPWLNEPSTDTLL